MLASNHQQVAHELATSLYNICYGGNYGDGNWSREILPSVCSILLTLGYSRSDRTTAPSPSPVTTGAVGLTRSLRSSSSVADIIVTSLPFPVTLKVSRMRIGREPAALLSATNTVYSANNKTDFVANIANVNKASCGGTIFPRRRAHRWWRSHLANVSGVAPAMVSLLSRPLPVAVMASLTSGFYFQHVHVFLLL